MVGALHMKLSNMLYCCFNVDAVLRSLLQLYRKDANADESIVDFLKNVLHSIASNVLQIAQQNVDDVGENC